MVIYCKNFALRPKILKKMRKRDSSDITTFPEAETGQNEALYSFLQKQILFGMLWISFKISLLLHVASSFAIDADGEGEQEACFASEINFRTL